MKIAIVGSRKRSFGPGKKVNKIAKEEVEYLVDSLDADDTVVSGGCKGIDSWAIDAAIKRGLKTHIYLPFIYDTMDYGEMVQEYYRRNREVVNESDVVYAFVPKDNVKKGGTWYTVNYATQQGKEVIVL